MRYAIRLLARSPAFSLTIILTLALGIGASTVMFSVLEAVLLRQLPYRQSNRLVMVWRVNLGEGAHKGTVSYPDFTDWNQQNTTFESMSCFHGGVHFSTSDSLPPTRVEGVIASANLFALLKVQPALGRVFSPGEDAPPKTGGIPVILSYRLWRSRYGSNANVVGRPIILNRKEFTVVGIMPPRFQFPPSDDSVDIWTTMAAEPQGRLGSIADRSWRYLYVIPRLKPGALLKQAQVEMDAIAGRLAKEYGASNKGKGAWVQPLLESLAGDVRTPLLTLFGGVICMMLIGCANVANLLSVRGARRREEIAIRAALGATRRRVIRQLMLESAVFAFLGVAVGLVAAKLALRVLLQTAAPNIPRFNEAHIDTWVLAFAVVLASASVFVFGLIPALDASRGDLIVPLKEASVAFTTSRIGNRTRRGLIITQVALSVVLLTTAATFVQSLISLENVHLGFNPLHVLTLKISLPEDSYPPLRQRVFFQRAFSAIRALPFVSNASAVDILPFGGYILTSQFQVEGRPPLRNPPTASVSIIDPDYFKTLAVPLLAGRTFNEFDNESSRPVVIVNSSLSQRYFQRHEVVGEKLKLTSSVAEIVGVVGDMKSGGLAFDPGAAIYLPFAQAPSAQMAMVVRAKVEPDILVSAIRERVTSLDSGIPIFDVRSLQAYVSQSIAQPHFDAVLLTIFAALALVLSIIGLYGTVSCDVEQQVREIGVRMAMGAPQNQIIRRFLSRVLSTTLVGILLGAVGSAAVGRVIVASLHGVRATEGWRIVGVAIIMLIVSSVASYFPAKKASRLNPSELLRHE